MIPVANTSVRYGPVTANVNIDIDDRAAAGGY